MTKQELSQLYHLNRKIELLQKELLDLKARAYSPSGPNLTGMPSGKGGNQGKVEKYAAEIADLEAIIAAKQIECIHERNRLVRWIAEIPDSPEQDIFYLRYVSGFSWQQVAASIGGGNSVDSVRKRHDRYLQRTSGEDVL